MLLIKDTVMSWNEKANNIGFPTFKLLPSTKNILRLTR